VGIRFYDGVAHPGEFVHLVREPDNLYDSNAIRVDNMNLEKVGHIKATVAMTLAPFMDSFKMHLPSSTIQMDGIIKAEGNQYTLPLEIEFFSKTLCGLSDFARVNDQFRSCGKDWNPNPVYAAAIGLTIDRPIEVVQQTMKWETAQENLDQMFDQLVQDQLLNLPNVDMPPALSTPLLDHQLEGIRWMYHKEKMAISENISGNDVGPVNSIPFYKPVKEKGRTMWFCDITNATQAMPPAPIKGSIL
jgi:SWI/SNF-related matrix-associated actin-dependent regulator of chromatin subfamily A3